MEIKCAGQGPELYKKLKAKFQSYQSQGKLAQVKDIAFNDSTCTAIAKGTGFSADIHCKDSVIVVDLDLNFLLKPMRGQIEAMIQKTVAKAVGAVS